MSFAIKFRDTFNTRTSHGRRNLAVAAVAASAMSQIPAVLPSLMPATTTAPPAVARSGPAVEGAGAGWRVLQQNGSWGPGYRPGSDPMGSLQHPSDAVRGATHPDVEAAPGSFWKIPEGGSLADAAKAYSGDPVNVAIVIARFNHISTPDDVPADRVIYLPPRKTVSAALSNNWIEQGRRGGTLTYRFIPKKGEPG